MLTKREEEVKALRQRVQVMQDSEKLMTVKYNKKIAGLIQRFEQEKEIAKKGLLELSEMSKRQEKMFSASICEIETFMNQLISEKKGGKQAATVTQMMLNKLVEEQEKGRAEVKEKERALMQPQPHPQPQGKPPSPDKLLKLPPRSERDMLKQRQPSPNPAGKAGLATPSRTGHVVPSTRYSQKRLPSVKK